MCGDWSFRGSYIFQMFLSLPKKIPLVEIQPVDDYLYEVTAMVYSCSELVKLFMNY